MTARELLLILSLLLLPSVAGCAGDQDAAPPPPSAASLEAVTDEPGTDRVRLARAIDTLFDADSVGETRALLVMHRGNIVAERYAPGFSAETRQLGWSLAQCVTGVLVGQLVSDGRLRLDETAPVPAWQRSGDPRGEITVRQLLQMRSGLRHEETTEGHFKSDKAKMLYLEGRDDMAAYAEAQPLEAEPGREFEFSSGSAIILSDLAGRALTSSEDAAVRRKAVADYLQTRVLNPAGMDSVVAEYDAAGTLIGSSMIHATARDWGRLGEFIRHGGSVRGAQVIPHRWIEFMRRPSPRNPGYGALLWLNQPQPDDSEVLFPGKAPSDLFACIGDFGQYVIGVPSEKLTVVRLGRSENEDRAMLRGRLGDLVALYAAGAR